MSRTDHRILSRTCGSLLAVALLVSTVARAALPPALQQLAAKHPGTVLYVDFWASWCGPCAQSFPWLNRLQAAYGKRLQVIGVDVDQNRADGEAFLKQHPADFTVLFDPDGKLASRYRIEGMPSGLVLTADGRVLNQHTGFLPSKTDDYESAIRKAMKLNPLKVNR